MVIFAATFTGSSVLQLHIIRSILFIVTAYETLATAMRCIHVIENCSVRWRSFIPCHENYLSFLSEALVIAMVMAYAAATSRSKLT